jgi:hypothetical protein
LESRQQTLCQLQPPAQGKSIAIEDPEIVVQAKPVAT